MDEPDLPLRQKALIIRDFLVRSFPGNLGNGLRNLDSYMYMYTPHILHVRAQTNGLQCTKECEISHVRSIQNTVR